MRRRWPTVIRGLAAAAVLLGVLVGVPILLAREVGWPLPTRLPALDDVGRAMASGAIADATIVKTLAVLVWLAWANFAAGLATEVIAVVRGRPVRQVGGFRTGQQVAGRLLSTISLAVVTLSRPEVAAAVETSDLRLAVATAAAEPAPLAMPVDGAVVANDGRTVGGVPTQGLRDGEASTRLHEVERGDTFWDLAERSLGDGLRWREIRDANVGRVQPDGRRMGVNTEELQLGWTLRIPSGGEERPTDDVGVIVESGDTLWDLAEENLDDGHRWPEIYELNRGDPQPGGGALVDPDVLQPGWHLSLPDGEVVGTSDLNGGTTATTSRNAEAEQDEDEPPPPSRPRRDIERDDAAAVGDLRPVPSTNRGVTGTVGNAAQSAPAETIDRSTGGEEPDTDADDELVPLLVPGVFAAGVVLTLDRIRRTRMRKRQPGKRIPLPHGDDAEGEKRLRATRDDDMNDFLDLALRELGHLMGDVPLPRVRSVTVDADDLRVYFEEDAPADACPGPWRPHDATTWLRPRAHSPASLRTYERTPAPLPALVTLGRTPDEGLLFLNLDGDMPVHVTADPACGQILLHTWALELATTPRADAIDVIAVGIDEVPDGLERLDEAEPGELRPILDRVIDPGDVTGPTTVVLAASASEDDVEDLTAATRQRDSVAGVILAAETGAVTGRRIDVQEGHVAKLEPDGLEVELLEPCCTPPMTARLLEQALHDPDQLAQLPELEPEGGHAAELEAQPIATVVEGPDDAGTVEVRILGPVEIVGAPGPFRTTKTIELITYLTMHRSGADTDTLMEALWPNQRPRAARLHTEASRARKAVGSDAAGNPRLPPAELGRYRLADTVVLDLDRFEVAVERARREPEHAVDHLRTALDLVRGIPLSSTGYEYTWATNDTYCIAQQVVDTAHMLAELALESQQFDLVTWAAEQGLLACPHAEPLYRDLMRSAAARGDRAGLPSVMTRLRSVVSDDTAGHDGDDWLAPETVCLYEGLTKQLRRTEVLEGNGAGR